MRVGLIVLPLMLAGCGGEGSERNAGRSVVITGNANELIMPAPRPDDGNVVNASAVIVPAVALAPDGLGLVADGGAIRHARFGMPRAAVTRMLAAALGDPIEESDNQECGAGALGMASFRDGLGVYFEGDKFAGWDLDGGDAGRFTTAAGIGIGATRKQLESATAVTIEDSTLGIEFSAGDLSGLLSSREPGGEITNLWAGTTCIAR
jgi:hypothetical protein